MKWLNFISGDGGLNSVLPAFSPQIRVSPKRKRLHFSNGNPCRLRRETGQVNRALQCPHVCVVLCPVQIEKQRRIERIKQKRAQLQELLLQVSVPGSCLSLPVFRLP